MMISCTPSEAAIQEAIAATEAYEENIRETEQAIVSATEAYEENVKKTEQATLSATQAAMPQDCTPVGTYNDLEEDASIDYFDILKVESTLDGNLLTCTFFLKNLPEEITINKAGDGYGEYTWAVDIDTDHDPDTGISGFGMPGIDYSMSIFHFAYGSENTGPIEEMLKYDAQVWKSTDDGSMEYNENASFTVNYEENSISLTGNIPDINEDSLVYFYTRGDTDQDYLCE
jgi:hypothetical protein